MARNPDDGIWGRLLLGIQAAGFTWIGSLVWFLASVDSGESPNLQIGGAVAVGVGVAGLVGMATGRAFSRWMLASYGLILALITAEFTLEALSYSNMDLFRAAVLVALTGLGTTSLVVGVRQILEHRELNQAMLRGSTQLTDPDAHRSAATSGRSIATTSTSPSNPPKSSGLVV